MPAVERLCRPDRADGGSRSTGRSASRRPAVQRPAHAVLERPRQARRSRVSTRSSSHIAGATASAAAVGVDARTSATMSAIEVSGSCPIPVTTGTGHATTARATSSALNGIRSSYDPPPRTSSTTSGRCSTRLACPRRSPRRTVALDLHAGDEHLGERVAPAQRAHDVVDRLAARRGHDRDALRERAAAPACAPAASAPRPRACAQARPPAAAGCPHPQASSVRTRNCIRPLGMYAEKSPGDLDQHAAPQLDAAGDVGVAPHQARHRRAPSRHGEVRGLVPGLVVELGDLADDAQPHALERALRAVIASVTLSALVGHGLPSSATHSTSQRRHAARAGRMRPPKELRAPSTLVPAQRIRCSRAAAAPRSAPPPRT